MACRKLTNPIPESSESLASENFRVERSDSAEDDEVAKTNFPNLIIPKLKNSETSDSALSESSPSPIPEHEEDFDLNNVQVVDDLSINRWLMRIMRLGANYVSTGSNGYKSAASKTSTTSYPPQCQALNGYLSSLRGGGRRFSACDTSLLRPALTTRGRRMSDSINLPGHPANNPKSFKFQRRGFCLFSLGGEFVYCACRLIRSNG